MRIYVLEDDPERIVSLCRYFDAHNRLSQKQAARGEKAADEISSQWSQTCERRYDWRPPYDLILLDHDLGGRQMLDHPDNGRTFLKSILTSIGDALVVIHSHNAGAAAAMKADYPPAVVAPFNDIRFWTVLNAALRSAS